jgi:tRNA (adenine22-N1)-methyltransferase
VFSERINCIEKLIKTNGIVVDVGSDHAQLAIMLLTHQKVKHVFNIEINKGPYLNTVQALQKTSFFDKTTNLLGDGLQKLITDKSIDYCVIAGLGANTIIDILQNKHQELKIKNYLLIPNNKTPILRE